MQRAQKGKIMEMPELINVKTESCPRENRYYGSWKFLALLGACELLK